MSYQTVKSEAENITFENLEFDNIDFEDNINSFLSQLKNEKDIIIFKMLYLEYTQEQIAKHLGYANNTAITKRLVGIRKEYLK